MKTYKPGKRVPLTRRDGWKPVRRSAQIVLGLATAYLAARNGLAFVDELLYLSEVSAQAPPGVHGPTYAIQQAGIGDMFSKANREAGPASAKARGDTRGYWDAIIRNTVNTVTGDYAREVAEECYRVTHREPEDPSLVTRVQEGKQ